MNLGHYSLVSEDKLNICMVNFLLFVTLGCLFVCGFLFLLEHDIGGNIRFWQSLSLPYNYLGIKLYNLLTNCWPFKICGYASGYRQKSAIMPSMFTIVIWLPVPLV